MGLFPAGQGGKGYLLWRRGNTLFWWGFSMEAEICAVAPWRKDQGWGGRKVQKGIWMLLLWNSQSGARMGSAQQFGRQNIWIKWAKRLLKEWFGRPRNFLCFYFRVRNNLFFTLFVCDSRTSSLWIWKSKTQLSRSMKNSALHFQSNTYFAELHKSSLQMYVTLSLPCWLLKL